MADCLTLQYRNVTSPVTSAIFFAVFFLIRQASYFMSDSVIRTVLRYAPSPSIQRLLKISDTMSRRSREITAERKLALEKGDVELAKINADMPEDDEPLRKKLWLKIAQYVVQDKKDIKTWVFVPFLITLFH